MIYKRELMDIIFADVRDWLHGIVDSGLKFETSFSVGILVQIEYYMREYEKTCHIYVMHILESLLKKATVVLEKFVNEQIKAIEECRVNYKKKTGILSFFRTFPVSNFDHRNSWIRWRRCCQLGMDQLES